MGTTISKWRPTWWTERVHGTGWQHVCEAMRCDWMETTHDLGLGGDDTSHTLVAAMKHALGTEYLPALNGASHPKVIGEWSEAEIPYAYGYAARVQFGAQHPHWNSELDETLEREWVSGREDASEPWKTVRGFVRRGYEYEAEEVSGEESSVGAPAPRMYEASRSR
jgi:hypothetical protein